MKKTLLAFSSQFMRKQSCGNEERYGDKEAK
jgi:hypothetical protein